MGFIEGASQVLREEREGRVEVFLASVAGAVNSVIAVLEALTKVAILLVEVAKVVEVTA